MGIIKENNFYSALYNEYGLQTWCKFAEYKSSVDGEEFTVITSLVVTKENNKDEIVYKINLFNNWISYDNLSKQIDNILYYLAYTTVKEQYWINTFLNKAILNKSFIELTITVNNLKKEQKKIKEELKVEESKSKILKIDMTYSQKLNILVKNTIEIYSNFEGLEKFRIIPMLKKLEDNTNNIIFNFEKYFLENYRIDFRFKNQFGGSSPRLTTDMIDDIRIWLFDNDYNKDMLTLEEQNIHMKNYIHFDASMKKVITVK